MPGQERADEEKEREGPTGNLLAILSRGRQQKHPDTQTQMDTFRANRHGRWSCHVVYSVGGRQTWVIVWPCSFLVGSLLSLTCGMGMLERALEQVTDVNPGNTRTPVPFRSF